jgi:uncharacterized surface protein with fasciclin (FAS1) repeats
MALADAVNGLAARPLLFTPSIAMKLHACIPLALAAATLALSSCSNDNDTTSTVSTTSNISQSLAGLGLTTLATAIQTAELDDDLAGAGPFTLFAPSNAAFAALPPGTLDSLLQPSNRAQLVAILTNHVLTSEVPSTTAVTLSSATPLGGGSLLLDVVGTDLFINDAKVTRADVDATNGVIHVVDQVLLPRQSVVETLQARGFSTLVTAVGAANLATTLSGPGPFTVLAPTNAAFAALPAGALDSLLLPANQAQLARILTYHVVPGTVAAGDAAAAELATTVQGAEVLFSFAAGEVRVNGTRVRTINIPCTNGVVHVLDAVLQVPQTIAATAQSLGFSTLVVALDAAQLTATFADGAAGPFTVFAPTDAAFAALPAGLLTQLLQPVNRPVLQQILRFHVAPQALTAADVAASVSQGIPTLQNVAIPVTAAVSGPRLGGFSVLTANVLAENGVIHAIDGVLVPPGVLAQLQ